MPKPVGGVSIKSNTMITDPISDMLVRIKNAQAVNHEQVSIPFSKMKASMAEILKSAGYVSEIEKKSKKSGKSEHEYRNPYYSNTNKRKYSILDRRIPISKVYKYI